MRPAEAPVEEIPARKADHIDITTSRPVTPDVSPGWDDVHLVHCALPEIDLQDVDLSVDFLGHHLHAPLVIASMTGGHPRAEAINQQLARAAEELGAAIRRPDLLSTYLVARETAPNAFLIANVGAPQLVQQRDEPPLTVDQVAQLVGVMRADALAIHLNYLQEVVQPEGDTRAAGVLAAIRRVVASVPAPVIAKETGAGISRGTGRALVEAGIAALDVGGAGGTSFALVEAHRAADRGLGAFQRLGETLGAWGLPTAVAIASCQNLGVPIIATGGIRSGLDAAKALALGADMVSLARPLMAAALEGYDALRSYIEELLTTLRTVLFLTGSRTPADLRAKERVVLGRTGEWLGQLKLGSERLR